jgi:hypothetical protein
MTSIRTITTQQSAAGSGFFAARIIDRARDGWRRWQTERAIEAMPADMRKDFGWPTSDIRDNAHPQTCRPQA